MTPVAFELDMKGLDEQLAKFKDFRRIAGLRLRGAMDKSVTTIASNVRPLVPVGVSGRLRNSIASNVTNEGNLSFVGKVGSTLTGEVYPEVMEFGRRPGSMPPPQALERWVHLKLQIPNDEAVGVAVRIARKIKARGITGKFFMKRGWEASEPKVVAHFERALHAIAEDLENGRS